MSNYEELLQLFDIKELNENSLRIAKKKSINVTS